MEPIIESLLPSLRVGHGRGGIATVASGGEWEGYSDPGAGSSGHYGVEANGGCIIFREGEGTWRLAAAMGWPADRSTHIVRYLIDRSGDKPRPWLLAWSADRRPFLCVSADRGRTWARARRSDLGDDELLLVTDEGLTDLPCFTLEEHPFAFAAGELVQPRRPIVIELDPGPWRRGLGSQRIRLPLRLTGEILDGKLRHDSRRRGETELDSRGDELLLLHPPLPGTYHLEIRSQESGAPALGSVDLALSAHARVRVVFDGRKLAVVPRPTNEELRAAKKQRLERQRHARANHVAAMPPPVPPAPATPAELVRPRDPVVEQTIEQLFRVAYKREEPHECEHGEYTGMRDPGCDGWCLVRRLVAWSEVLNPEWLGEPGWHRLHYAPSPPGSAEPRFWLFATTTGELFVSPDGGIGWRLVGTSSGFSCAEPAWIRKLPCVQLAEVAEGEAWRTIQEPRRPVPHELRLDFESWRSRASQPLELWVTAEADFLDGRLRYTHSEWDARGIGRGVSSPLVLHLPSCGRYRIGLEQREQTRGAPRSLPAASIELDLHAGDVPTLHFDGQRLVV